MKRWLFLVYGIGCHLLFLATFLYMACFVGGFLVPHTTDRPVAGSFTSAVIVNLALLSLFAVQHSLMARPAFKRRWTRMIPTPIERSTYVLASCLVTIVVMWQWRGMGLVVWDVQQPIMRAALWALFAAGWLMVPLVSLMIDHFDLFGVRQVWLYFRRREYQPLPFREPFAYRHVRHPLYVGWAIAFWATPTMTAGHLLFAAVLTGYMGVATILEERDLAAHFGRRYHDYCRRVPRFVPRLKPASADRSLEG